MIDLSSANATIFNSDGSNEILDGLDLLLNGRRGHIAMERLLLFNITDFDVEGHLHGAAKKYRLIPTFGERFGVRSQLNLRHMTESARECHRLRPDPHASYFDGLRALSLPKRRLRDLCVFTLQRALAEARDFRHRVPR
jgi:hypothetical protein